MFEPKYLRMQWLGARRKKERGSMDFSLDFMRPKGVAGQVAAAFFRRLLVPVLFVLQCFWPVLRWRRFLLVTRADDVAAILGDPEGFPVPFGPEMQSLGAGATFLLGLEGPDHDRQRRIITSVVKRSDLAGLEAQADSFAKALLESSKGRIDAQRDLVQRVAAETCARYFGLPIDDPDLYAEWTIACSQLLFADPLGDPVARDMAEAAAARIGALIDRTVAATQSGGHEHAAPPETLVARLVELQAAGGADAPTNEEIRAILLGLSVGFVPTNSMAGGKILDLLSRKGEARREAIEAARAGDAQHFEQVLREAMRLAPAIAPGQWRWTRQDTQWTRPGGRTFRVRRNTLVMVATQIALRDPRKVVRPWRFEYDRTDTPPLVFGNHAHSCIGEHIAIAQLRGSLMPLLAQDGIEDSLNRLRVKWLGAFPEHAWLQFDHDEGAQKGQFIVIEAKAGTTAGLNARIAEIDARLERLRPRLDQAGLLHFCSMTAIDAPTTRPPEEHADGRTTDTLLVIEVNGDGEGTRAIAAFVRAMNAELRALLAAAGVEPGLDLVTYLLDKRLDLTSAPWGATALQFYGHQGLSARDIAAQDELAGIASEALQATLQANIGLVASASATLREVRRRIVARPDGARWAAYMLKPSQARMDLSWWDDPLDGGFVLRLLRTRAMKRVGLVLVAVALASAWAIGQSEGFAWGGLASLPHLLWLGIAGVMLSLSGGALVAGGFLAMLRLKESRDVPDGAAPSLDHLRECAAHEDKPDHVHNHILVVTPLKKGLIRRLALALALWGIAVIVTFRFRPGFVLNMGTIHFARWVRLPGRDTMVFQSNYDGSWESYLEDFITRAHWGQSAAWSNGEGFPRTRFLISGGAEDGDNFKRYVRRKQVPTRFWYARFRNLTSAAMRRNALIHDGLARARTESEARSWLALFGSGQLTRDRLESDEIQSLVFTGFGKLRHSTALLIRFGEQADDNRKWLRNLTGFRNATPDKSLLFEMDEVRERRLGRVTFGEAERFGTAVSLGLSAEGLRVLEMPASHPERGFNALPGPFAFGMTNRARRLGDDGEEAPQNWRWRDAEDGAVHAILLLYAADEEGLARLAALHRRFAERAGVSVVDEVPTTALPQNGHAYDHFGFRDGIVQPVIAGTAKAALNRVPSDIIPPGEMVLGYANAQGYLTPGIPVDKADDPFDRLPEMPREPQRYPRFGGDEGARGPRDFGRNGAFLAVRQLEQHVVRFSEAMEAAANQIHENYPELPSLLGHDVDANWVAARLVGRWKNGAPLMRNPLEPDRKGPELPMLFGADDPSGLQCPLGAHVRRANPRDSFEPGDPTELGIVNRHRLVRRGRSYERPASDGGAPEQGLLFMAVCEDLERQFEFVQRSWLDSPVFHDLDRENDPIVGRCPAGHKRSFRIPTSSGPIQVDGLPQFVTLRAGGYFFLPSRSAMLWLARV